MEGSGGRRGGAQELVLIQEAAERHGGEGVAAPVGRWGGLESIRVWEIVLY
jgi:hypothetical protein